VAKRQTVTEQLREAILAAPISRRQIALATGVIESSISRFVNRKAGIDGTSIDRLCQYLGLELTAVEKPKGGKS
jgi:transcriptional regulator with XRE-family HTH domain